MGAGFDGAVARLRAVLGMQHHVELAAHGVLHLAQLAHRGADLTADFGQTVRSEDQQRHEQDDEDFRRVRRSWSDPSSERKRNAVTNARRRSEPGSRSCPGPCARVCVRNSINAGRRSRAEPVEGSSGGWELTANPCDQHCQPPGPERGDRRERRSPSRHDATRVPEAGALTVERATDFGRRAARTSLRLRAAGGSRAGRRE